MTEVLAVGKRRGVHREAVSRGVLFSERVHSLATFDELVRARTDAAGRRSGSHADSLAEALEDVRCTLRSRTTSQHLLLEPPELVSARVAEEVALSLSFFSLGDAFGSLNRHRAGLGLSDARSVELLDLLAELSDLTTFAPSHRLVQGAEVLGAVFADVHASIHVEVLGALGSLGVADSRLGGALVDGVVGDRPTEPPTGSGAGDGRD